VTTSDNGNAAATVDARLSQIDDRRAIHDVLVRYCAGVDRLDADLVASAYHPDATDSHGPFRYTGDVIGPELIERMNATNRISSHMIVNERVELDGDMARTECYYIAHEVQESPADATVDVISSFYGRYLDRFERRNGEWRISDRAVLVDWASVREQVRPVHENLAPDAPWMGRRTRDDRSYTHFSIG
jgi:hypothetical protein